MVGAVAWVGYGVITTEAQRARRGTEELRSEEGAILRVGAVRFWVVWQDGWELVQVVPGPNSENMVAYLKRPKGN